MFVFKIDFRLKNTSRKYSDDLYYTAADMQSMPANNMLSTVYNFSHQPHQIQHQMQSQPPRAAIIHYSNHSIGSRYKMDQFQDHPLRGPKSSPSRLITNIVQHNSSPNSNIQHHVPVRQISQPMSIMQQQSSLSPSHVFPYTVHSQPAHTTNIIPNAYQSSYMPHYTNGNYTNNIAYVDQSMLQTANNISIAHGMSYDDDDVSHTYSESIASTYKKSKHRSRVSKHRISKHHMKKKQVSYNRSNTSTSDEYSYIKQKYRKHQHQQYSSQCNALSYTLDSDEERTNRSGSGSSTIGYAHIHIHTYTVHTYVYICV